MDYEELQKRLEKAAQDGLVELMEPLRDAECALIERAKDYLRKDLDDPTLNSEGVPPHLFCVRANVVAAVLMLQEKNELAARLYEQLIFLTSTFTDTT